MKPVFTLPVYAERRRRFLSNSDAVAIIPASPEVIRSHDTHYPYRPSSDLVYLTGFEEPGALLVLRPGDPEKAATLFVRPSDPKQEQWTGRRAGVDGARVRFGLDAVHPIAELDEKLPELLAGRRNLYYLLNHSPELDQRVFRAMDSLRGGRGKPNRAPEAVIDPRPTLHDQRRLKTAEEVAVMREAARITAEAHVEAMRRVHPGMMEFELAALLDFAFRRRGAVGPGYETIVGGGANAIIRHYTENSQALQDGTLVLVDAGCEYLGYQADITRTFPVGRRFTPAQRAVYEAVLEVNVEGIARAKSGESAHGNTLWARRRLAEQCVALGLLRGDLDKIMEDKAYERFFMHGLGHYLGMDVHDVGTYLVDEEQPLPLEPGVVLTVEPGLYIPDEPDIPEEFRGIGVRIEDDVLVTPGGPEVLTGGVPKDVAAIEALRQEGL